MATIRSPAPRSGRRYRARRRGVAAARQERIVRGQQSAGYAVHGNPGIVVPVADTDAANPVPRAIRRHDTLELGLTVLGRAWTRRGERGDA